MKKLNVDSISTTNGSPAFTVHAKNHGMYAASNSVIIAGAAGDSNKVNNIPIGEINGTHTITSFTHDTFTIANSGGTNANATAFGGGNAMTITQNFVLDTVFPLIENIQVPGTSIRAFMKPHKGKSANGSELNLFSQDTGEIEILPNKNFTFISPRLIASGQNESVNMSSRKSMEIRLEMTSTDSGLSPIIDMNRTSMFAIQNRINSESGSEAVASNGPNVSKYFTKVITLDEPADVSDVFLNVKQPSGTTVELYFRALGGQDADINTVAFTQATPETTIPTGNTFKEVHFATDPLGAGTAFSQIQFKIVMKSTRSSKVPEIKDLRAICST